MFKWFRKLKQEQLNRKQLEEIEAKELAELQQQIVDDTTIEVIDGKFVGWKYRVYRSSKYSYVVQRYIKQKPSLYCMTIPYHTDDGWITAIFDTPYDTYARWPRAKYFKSVEEAEAAAIEYALKRKQAWEDSQLIGPAKDLGRLP